MPTRKLLSLAAAGLLGLVPCGADAEDIVFKSAWQAEDTEPSLAALVARENENEIPLQEVGLISPGFGLIAGAEWTYLKPHFDHGVTQLVSSVFGVVDGGGVITFFDELTVDDVPWNYKSAPRLWAGIENSEGFGGRIVWWYFDHTTGPQTLLDFPVVDMSALGQQDIRAYTLDVEFTQRTNFRNWSLLGSAGIRYAEITTEQSILFFDSFFDASSDFRSKMSGVGPSLGLQVSRPVLGGLSLFMQGRGSLIYGNGREQANLDVLWLGIVDEELIVNSSRDDLMAIAEFRIGGEWIRPMENGNTLFLRSTFETQYWSGAVKDNNAFNYTTDDIGFLGFTLGAGVGY